MTQVQEHGWIGRSHWRHLRWLIVSAAVVLIAVVVLIPLGGVLWLEDRGQVTFSEQRNSEPIHDARGNIVATIPAGNGQWNVDLLPGSYTASGYSVVVVERGQSQTPFAPVCSGVGPSC